MSEPDFSLVKSYCSIENTPIHIHNHQANQETDFFGSVLFSSLLTKKRTSDKKNKIPLFYWSIDDLQKIQKYNLVIWYFYRLYYVSVQFSHSVVYNSLRPHESQHARPPCPSPTPRVHSNSRPSSPWCHPATSSSVVPFSPCPQSLPASGSFPMSQLLAWGGQSAGVSALASFLPKNTQDWSPSGWTGWISLQSKGLSRVFSNNTVQKHQFFGAQLSL